MTRAPDNVCSNTARRLLLAVFAVLATSASVLGEPPAKTAPSEAYPAEGQPVAVTLVSAGQGPMRAMRWAPKLGASTTMVMDVGLDVVTQMGDTVAPHKITMTMALTLDAEVATAKKDGGSVVKTQISRAKVEIPALASLGKGAMDAATDALQSMTLTTTSDARGLSTKTSMKGSPMAEQMMSSVNASFDHLSMAWPAKPIGVGAKWETRGTVNANNMLVRAKNVYTLEAFDPATQVGRVSVRISQTAGKQPVPMPMGSASLTQLTGGGSGTIVFNLAKPGMVLPTLEMTVNADMTVKAMGQTLAMATTTKAKVKVSESKALTPPTTP